MKNGRNLQISVVSVSVSYKRPIPNFDFRFNVVTQKQIFLVPVINIFGYSLSGEKLCVHVHGGFPYFYIMLPSFVKQNDRKEKLSFVKKLKLKIENSMQTNVELIYSIEEVVGVPFYGYFDEELGKRTFMKIKVFKQYDVSKICAVLMSGTLGKTFQPYESHLPFLLQFFIDHNLSGFGSLNVLENCLKYRSDSKVLSGCENPVFMKVKGFTKSLIEVDLRAIHILNVLDINHSKITEDNQDINFVKSLETIWSKEKKRRQLVYDKSQFSQEATMRRKKKYFMRTEIQDLFYKKLEKIVKIEDGKKLKKELEDLEDLFDGKVDDIIEKEVKFNWTFSQLPVQNQLLQNKENVIIKSLDWMRNGSYKDLDDDDHGYDEDEQVSLEEQNEIDAMDCKSIMEATQSYSKEVSQELEREKEKEKTAIDGDSVMKEKRNFVQPKFLPNKRKRRREEMDKPISRKKKKKRKAFSVGDFVYFPFVTKVKGKLVKRKEIGFVEAINDEDNTTRLRVFYTTKTLEKEFSRNSEPRNHKEIFASKFFERIRVKNIMGMCFVFPKIDTEALEKNDDYYLCQYFYDPIERKFSPLPKDLMKLFWKSLYDSKKKEQIDEEEKIYDTDSSVGSPFLLKIKSLDVEEEGEEWDEFDFEETCSLTPLAKEEVELEFVHFPPSLMEVEKEFEKGIAERIEEKSKKKAKKVQEKIEDFKAFYQEDFLSIMAIEIFSESKENFLPNPKTDQIQIIAVGMIVKTKNSLPTVSYAVFSQKDCQLLDCEVEVFKSEKLLIKGFLDYVLEQDPDILLGYETQKESLGYLLERYSYVFGMNMCRYLSRIVDRSFRKKHQDRVVISEYGRKKSAGFFVNGRIILNVWRILRRMIRLKTWSIENVYSHLFPGDQFPVISQSKLNSFFSKKKRNNSIMTMNFVFSYLLRKVEVVVQILNEVGVIERIGEFARIYGCEFEMVPYRGTQYKIECILFRLIKPRNFMAFSPTREQVRRQNPSECLPLVMEPMSGLYSNPVCVLDFQSLYPSIMIAYNLCFSTCLGSVVAPSEKGKRLGVVTNYKYSDNVLKNLSTMDEIFISPNGIMFVKKCIRYGIIPKMLKEILECRIRCCKKSMKAAKEDNDKFTYNYLDYKQDGLKQIANTTYGYFGAGYSGRMPCSDIDDAIVQMGREILENAIRYVEEKYKELGVRVVYGDTDSLFVEMPNFTKEEAFKFSRKICREVSTMNPAPIKLKFEKIYKPCFLITKKRYCGNCYESETQSEPFLESKGIETMRRDTCDSVNSILSEAIFTFFNNNSDFRVLKRFMQEKWKSILNEEVNLKDYIFYKRVKIGEYSNNPRAVLPPAVILAKKKMDKDTRAEPLYNQRIPFLVIYSSPNARLVDMVLDPLDYLKRQKRLSLHSSYYINKQMIPAMQRIFGLISNVNVHSWFAELPKSTKRGWKILNRTTDKSHYTIESYFILKRCSVCEKNSVSKTGHFCDECLENKQDTVFVVMDRNRMLQSTLMDLRKECLNCTKTTRCGLLFSENCSNVCCDILFRKAKTKQLIESNDVLLKEVNDW